MFPTKADQENAELALKNDFKVAVSTKSSTKLMPKIKIFDLHSFERSEKAELKEAILLKNNGVKQLVENGKSLEIIYIDDKNKSAVLKT